MRVGLCLLAIYLSACQTNETADSPDRARREAAVSKSPRTMPFGLSCDQCTYSHVQDCDWAADAPVVAVVSGSQELNVHRRCLAEPSAESPAVCLKNYLYQFASAQFLRNDLGATETDSFETAVSYDEVQTSDIESHAAQGVHLETNTRYVIFAAADRKDMGQKANWYISLACAIP
jgi:hypothetical protein